MHILKDGVKTVIAAFSFAVLALFGPAFAEPVSVDVEQSDPIGTSVSIESIERTETELRLGVSIINGAGHSVVLDSTGSGTYVQVGEDRRLMLVPPEGNRTLAVPAHSTIEGNLVFVGFVPELREMTVMFNADRHNNINAPHFEIALPAEAIAGAGSKKN